MQKSAESVPPAAQLIGRKLISYDPTQRVAVIEYQAKPEFTNRHGTVQGGLLSAMLDSATGIALVAGLTDGCTAITRRLDSEYLKPAAIGRLIATATVQEKSDTDAQVAAELATEAGTIVARATAYLRIKPLR